MTAADLALVAAAVLVALAVLPTAWILGREVWRRRATKRALREVALARAALVAEASGAAALTAALSARFDAVTIERVALVLLRGDDPSRELGARLFGQLALVERYARQLREAPKWSERAHAAEVLGLVAAPDAVPALVAAIRDRDEDGASVKVAAAAALARMRDPAAVPLLVKELHDIEEQSSRTVAEALVVFGSLAVPALLDLLAQPAHPPGRVWAARILGRIGDARATDDLTARLFDRDDLLRMAAAEALGAIGDGRALQPLVRATLRDPAPQVRAHAAGAVAKIEGERAIDVLVAALADPDHATRLRALEAFETMRISDTSPLESALRDPNVEVRRRAALALERVGYLDRIVGELTAEDREIAARAYAAFVDIGRVGLVDSVAAHVHHRSFEVRALAARAAGELGNASVGMVLLTAIEDEAWPVRAAVCEALGRLRHDGAVPALVARLTDAEESVREAAAEALTSYAPSGYAEELVRLTAAYDAGSVPLRRAVVTLVGRLGAEAPAASELLVRASADPSDGVRLCAVQSLAGRSGDAVVRALLARITDAALDVRMTAVSALGSTASVEAFEGLLGALSDSPPLIRERIAQALAGATRGILLERLPSLEKNPSLEVRLGVAWTLGKIGDQAGVTTLGRFLHDQSAALRASAAGALAKIASPEAAELLLGAVEDPDGRVRAAAINALGRAGDPRALAALEGRVRDPDPFVRNRALVAFARVGRAGVEERVTRLAEGVAPEARLVALALVRTEAALATVLGAFRAEGTLARVVAFLDREDPGVRKELFAALEVEDMAGPLEVSGDADALVARYEQTLRTSLDVAARRLAAVALGRLATRRAIEVLADALVADPGEEVRRRAAEALRSQVADRGARSALARAVADPNDDIAVSAIEALSGRREPEVAAALRRRLGTGGRVEEAVEAALAQVYRDDPLPLLDWMMGVDVPELLLPSVRVLAKLADPSTLPLLCVLVRSTSGAVRAAAVRALGQLPGADAAAAVETLVQDPNEDVRVAVLGVLMSSKDALLRTAPLRRDPSVAVRTQAAAALERATGPSARPALKILEGLLSDAAPRVRAAALATLLATGDPEWIRAFGKAWAETALDTRLELRGEPRRQGISARLAARLTSSPDPEERRCAIVGLGALGAPGFHQHLLPALRDPTPEVRVAAVQALATLDDDDVRARLSEMLSDPDGAVRDAARRSILRTVG